jgi:hypothetical protein
LIRKKGWVHVVTAHDVDPVQIEYQRRMWGR